MRRAGRDKLGVEVRVVRALGEESRGAVGVPDPDARLGGRDRRRRAGRAAARRGHAVREPALGRGRASWCRRHGTGRSARGCCCASGESRRARLSGVTPAPGILARGPWQADQVEARWLDEPYEPPHEIQRLADAAVDGLRERGSPSHDGLATRLVGWREDAGRLVLELQPSRWALRLVEGNACDSLTALCVVRAEDGRWLAGHRADWVSTWAGRWALGAGGAVDLRREPDRHALPRAARGVEARARAPQRGGAGGTARRDGDAGRAGDGRRRLRPRARPRARRVGLVARRRGALARRGGPAPSD